MKTLIISNIVFFVLVLIGATLHLIESESPSLFQTYLVCGIIESVAAVVSVIIYSEIR